MNNNSNTTPFTMRKQWIERLEKMGTILKFKCLAAAYEYIVNRRYTYDAEHDLNVREFLWYVIDDMKAAARRREVARRRREERKKAEELSRQALQCQIKQNQCFIADADEYRRCPSLFIFDAFMHYLQSPGGASLRPRLPEGKSLADMLMKFRRWAVETSRVGDISKLNVFRDMFARNLHCFA